MSETANHHQASLNTEIILRPEDIVVSRNAQVFAIELLEQQVEPLRQTRSLYSGRQ